MIKNSSIQQVMDTMRVDEVLADFLNLKRRGVNLLANCPFHDEKTPSFTISPAKGIYKCFGCGKSGNSVTFLMEHENISYVEAIRYLAKKYNITLEETVATGEEIQKTQEKESLFILNEFVTKYFQKNLLETEIGKTLALTYFKERGFTDKTIQDFQLGYCLDMRDELYKTLKREGFKEEYIVQLGLAKTYEDGSWRDFFRGRIIFPIHNLSGKVVGFGGRVMGNADKTAKYINSPENEIYHKSQILYGLHLAKKGIPKENYCILVEGYTDVISLYQAGVENAVASSGTALTVEQLKLIRRFTENLHILYDGDKAGIKAALRGTDLALESGLNVNLTLLKEGHDPDSFVKEYGGQALKDFIEKQSSDIVTFKAKLFKEEAGNDPVKRAELTKDIIQTISLVPDNIKRSFYVKECAILMGIEEDLLSRETQRIVNQRRKKQQTDSSKLDSNEDAYTSNLDEIGEEIKSFTENSSNLLTIEIGLCKLLLESGNKPIESNMQDDNPFFDEIRVVDSIFQEHWENFVFESNVCKEIFCYVKSNYDKGKVFPLEYYLNHTNIELANFTRKVNEDSQSLLMDWGRKNKKKGEKIEKNNYGENYRKEVEQIKDRVKQAYFERLGKEIRLITLQAIGDTKELTEDAKKCILIQQEYLSQFKDIGVNSNYIFRKLIK
ncbi:MAG: DNA primase [Chitinophagales bacterium]|nr:DNA primase [Chitinophagales bacterium]